MIHDYMGVDLEAAWQVTQQDLAQLRQAVEELLSKEEPIWMRCLLEKVRALSIELRVSTRTHPGE